MATYFYSEKQKAYTIMMCEELGARAIHPTSRHGYTFKYVSVNGKWFEFTEMSEKSDIPCGEWDDYITVASGENLETVYKTSDNQVYCESNIKRLANENPKGFKDSPWWTRTPYSSHLPDAEE